MLSFLFGAGLRMGRQGSSVDNWAKGGVFVGIDVEKGKLMETGFLKPLYGTSVKEHSDTHVVFKDFEIPYYKEAENRPSSYLNIFIVVIPLGGTSP